jgi:thioesterase domain-containing protein
VLDRPDAPTGQAALASLLPLREGGAESRSPLFCVHALFGLAWPYAGLLAHLDADRPVYGLQAQRLTDPVAAPATIDELAADYVEQIRGVQPHGPYHLLGWSFGGLVAHAMATRLTDLGESVGVLALVDSYPLDDDERAAKAGEGSAAADEQGALEFLLRTAGLQLDGSRLDRAGVRARLAATTGPLADLDGATVDAVVDVAAHMSRLMRTAVLDTFDGDTLAVTATADKSGSTLSHRRWRPYVSGGIDNHDVDCVHVALTDPGPMAVWGPVVNQTLRNREEGR